MRGAIVAAVALLASSLTIGAESGAIIDPSLNALRHAYVGKAVYGYGGLFISCSPKWTYKYAASTPLRVSSISRMTGTTARLGTGTATYPYVMGLSFAAVNPIRVVFAPSNEPPDGIDRGIRGIAGACPSIVMADWQADLLMSTTHPPRTLDVRSYAVRNGMSRSDVVWKRGYPRQLGDRRALNAEDTWNYSDSHLMRSIVKFRHDRVIYHDDRLLM